LGRGLLNLFLVWLGERKWEGEGGRGSGREKEGEGGRGIILHITPHTRIPTPHTTPTHKSSPGLLLHPQRRVLHWYEGDLHSHPINTTPAFIFSRQDQLVYGFPPIRQRPLPLTSSHTIDEICLLSKPTKDSTYLIKAGIHYAPYLGGKEEESCDPDLVSHEVTEEEASQFDQIIPKYLRGIGKRVRSKVCLYTTTSDGHFVIDKVHTHTNVIVAAGFSGHGFKFGLTVGKILVRMVCGEEVGFDLAPFSMRRRAVCMDAKL
jgi:hypothetical protein